MPIKEMWYKHRMECIEVFLERVFRVQDEYTQALRQPATVEEHDRAWDILKGYQDIALRAIYSELNVVVELELKNLLRAIPGITETQVARLGRKRLCDAIETHYKIRLEDLPGFDGVDEIRRIVNAYKHDDGFSGSYEEVFPGLGDITGYRETRHELNEEHAFESIKVVREFMRALPGQREELPRSKPKPEDEATHEAREIRRNKLLQSGAWGHRLGKAIAAGDGSGQYIATCQFCGKQFWGEDERACYINSIIDSDCPGIDRPE